MKIKNRHFEQNLEKIAEILEEISNYNKKDWSQANKDNLL